MGPWMTWAHSSVVDAGIAAVFGRVGTFVSLGSPIFRRASRNPRRTQHPRCCGTMARAARVHMIMYEANGICKL